ncbi:MAG: phosphoribosylformylglycinamidine cyclo-ligase [Alphaproteobacteria bacterium]|nr:phosphoribosylformylglycinamidine cyclo-ligase [Alphaproteobacteria bacterium]
MPIHSYQSSGVNIDQGNNFVDMIKPLVAQTKRLGTMGNLGGFGGLFDMGALNYQDPVLVATTDGVGTKLKIAIELNQHHTIGQDLVAMCVNDLIVQGAEPLFFLDYFATSKLSLPLATEVIKGITQACQESGCSLIGGETAEMPGIYHQSDYDLAGFAVGVVERSKLLPKNTICEGDIIIALPSSGVHSNGFSLVRHLVHHHDISYHNPAPFFPSRSLGDVLLTPTHIYVKSCLEAFKTNLIKGLAHITGGGLLDNIPRILPSNLTAYIDTQSWTIPSVFKWLKKIGNIDPMEMVQVFNCGIGMICLANQTDYPILKEIFAKHHQETFIIGKIGQRNSSNAPVVFNDFKESWAI